MSHDTPPRWRIVEADPRFARPLTLKRDLRSEQAARDWLASANLPANRLEQITVEVQQ